MKYTGEGKMTMKRGRRAEEVKVKRYKGPGMMEGGQGLVAQGGEVERQGDRGDKGNGRSSKVLRRRLMKFQFGEERTGRSSLEDYFRILLN